MTADAASIASRSGRLIAANSARRALDIIGDRWVLSILYFAFQGVRRFDDFQDRIGLARSLLTDRLQRLHKADIFIKHRYQDRPVREEYRLSQRGIDLYPTALAIIGWEKRWFFDADNVAHRIRHNCGHEFTPQARCKSCGEVVTVRRVRVEDGPGACMEEAVPPRTQRRSVVPSVELNHGNPMLDRAFQVLGDRWTSYIIASAFLGTRRFNEFQESLGVAPNILTDRLARLIEREILYRVPYQERPLRWEYRLTEKGLDLYPLIIQLTQWGDRWLANGKGQPLITYHIDCGAPLECTMTCDHCGRAASASTTMIQRQN